MSEDSQHEQHGYGIEQELRDQDQGEFKPTWAFGKPSLLERAADRIAELEADKMDRHLDLCGEREAMWRELLPIAERVYGDKCLKLSTVKSRMDKARAAELRKALGLD